MLFYIFCSYNIKIFLLFSVRPIVLQSLQCLFFMLFIQYFALYPATFSYGRHEINSCWYTLRFYQLCHHPHRPPSAFVTLKLPAYFCGFANIPGDRYKGCFTSHFSSSDTVSSYVRQRLLAYSYTHF